MVLNISPPQGRVRFSRAIASDEKGVQGVCQGSEREQYILITVLYVDRLGYDLPSFRACRSNAEPISLQIAFFLGTLSLIPVQKRLG
jgi:hypothetical protein